MRRIGFITLCLWISFAGLSYGQSVFINEFHYDNAGADINEGFEIAGPTGTSLTCYKVLLYNGSNGQVYNTINLGGNIPNQCNGFGTVWFSVSSIQNGGPDGIALVFDPSLAGCSAGGALAVIQFLSYEGSFTASNGDAVTLTSVDVGVSETNSSLATNSLQLTGNGTVYTDFTWAASASSTHDALNNGQTFSGVCGATTASELRFTTRPSGCYQSASPFSISVCATDAIGNVITSYSGTVTLSKSSGPGNLAGTVALAFVNGCATYAGLSFDAVGSYTLSATDGSISGSSGIIYISPSCATCPWMTGAHIDACGANEGNNEILFFNSGNSSLGVNGTDIQISYGTTNPPATNYTSGFISNQTYVDSLNATAACAPNLFVDAFSFGHIPPNSSFLLFRFDPINVYDYSNLCGTGPIFCIFSNDPDWNSTGNFKNCNSCGGSGATTRFFRCNFSSLPGSNSCDFIYSYVPCTDLVCSGNGDGLSFSYGGGTMSSNWNACVPNAPLPVLYAAPLTGAYVGTDIELQWRTAQETNSDYFIIERSRDPKQGFEEVGQVAAQGNSLVLHAYHWLDRNPPRGTLHYRLQQVDKDGNVAFSSVVSVSSDSQFAAVKVRQVRDEQRLEIDLLGHGEAQLRLFGIDGKTILEKTLGVVDGKRKANVLLPDLPLSVLLYEVRIGTEVFRGKAGW